MSSTTRSSQVATLIAVAAVAFFIISAQFASAYTGGMTQSNMGGGGSDFKNSGPGSSGASAGYPDARNSNNDNRPYSIPKIQACIKTHVTDVAASGAPTSAITLTKQKGDALIHCIKNARQMEVGTGGAQELLKKIEALREQIKKLRGQIPGSTTEGEDEDESEDEDEDEDESEDD